jgi:N-acetyltransferase
VNGSAVDLQLRLRGTLIELRPLQEEDSEALFGAASDPLIWEQHPEWDRWKPEVFQSFFDDAIASGGAFAVIDLKSGKIIGSSRYWDYNLDRREIEIRWTFLERAFWGGSYNRELKSLMLDHAFGFVDRVLFRVAENNIRSQRALTKIGARLMSTGEARAADEGVSANDLVFVIER